MSRDARWDDWIERARAVTVRAELERRGLWSRAMNGDAGVPCPGCGGRDRFAVNQRKNVFRCRASSAGGDAIALVQHIDGCDFLTAVEILTGRPPPGREEGETEAQRQARAEAAQKRAEEAAIRKRQDEENERLYRKRERERARRIWDDARPIAGTLAEDYLRLRGVSAPPGAHLRYLPSAPCWNAPPPHGKVIHEGPALVVGVTGFDGHFFGVEQVWIDLAQPKGKALIADPETGELVAVKKARGSKKGGSCMLVRWRRPTRLFLGEGIETVLSVWAALAAVNSPLLEEADFRATLSLLNLAGAADSTVSHPTLTRMDKAGHMRRVKVPNDVPAPLDRDVPLLAIPDSVRDLYLLGDGDSDPFATELAIRRAARRFRRGYPHLRVFTAWPRPGLDFNDQWLAEREGQAA